MASACARASANIAFIKYWGNRDDVLRLPVNNSFSMNLDGLYTETEVRWDDDLTSDHLVLNAVETEGRALERVSEHLDLIRNRLNVSAKALVKSVNNFPMGAGIASSASAFAALTVAAVAATGKTLSEAELTRLARQGSGSASRSVPSGFVVWHAGTSHKDSFAESIAGPDAWDLVDVIAIVSDTHKETGSTDGHKTANTSPLQDARVADADHRFKECLEAFHVRDFDRFARIVELDSDMMHAIMMTSTPSLFYWKPATLDIMQHVRTWRREGLDVCYTLDAGPNVHCICRRDSVDEVAERVSRIEGVRDIRRAGPGVAAEIIDCPAS